MSDTHDHDHEHHDHGGGHEIDRMPNSRLFNLLFGLSALTLLAGIGVVELFNMQVRALEDHRGAEPGFRIAEYHAQMQREKNGWGKVEVRELDDANTVSTRYYMPLANARRMVLDDPKQLEASKAKPPGWKTADDQAPQVAPAAGAPGTPRGAAPEGGAKPAEGPKPEAGAKPGEGVKPEEGAKPDEGAKPAEPAAPAEGDAPEKPARAPKPRKPADAPAEPAAAPAEPAPAPGGMN